MRIRWRGFELPTQVVLEKGTATDSYGKFEAEPFERGYGVTIGNALRRVLLSSLQGAAVASIRLHTSHKGDDGKVKETHITHEYTAIPGVYEDVTDLVLNIKELRLKLHTEESVTLRVERKSKGTIKAGDIVRDERFDIVNPELVLCTLTEDIGFNLEMVARPGRGYKTSEENITPDQSVGVIPVDSIFTPVKRVRFKVDNTRVGQRTDYDKLTLEIWTDGTVTPELALVEASNIIRKHLNPFVKYFALGGQTETRVIETVSQPVPEAIQGGDVRDKLKQSISVLGPSVRAENCLAAANIQTVGDLVRMNESEVLKIKNFGKNTLKEVKKKLGDLGLSLGMEVAADAEAPEDE